jgi:hypothetical protein
MSQSPLASRLAYPLFLAGILAVAALDRNPLAVRAAARPQAPATVNVGSFPTSAKGLLLKESGISATPWSAATSQLPPGTALSLNGMLRLHVGLRRVSVYRVSTVGQETIHGWVAGDAVLVQAGSVPLVDLRGDAPAQTAPAGAGTATTLPTTTEPVIANAVASLPLPVWLPPSVRRWDAPINTAAQRHGIDPALLAIILLVESGGWSQAESPAGAFGLAQLMPATAAEISAAAGHGGSPDAWRDPMVNIDLGAAYLAAQSRAFAADARGDARERIRLTAAAYNGGPGTLRRSLDGWGADLPTETKRYQRWVVGMWDERMAAHSAHFDEWRAAGGERLLSAADAEP